MAEMFDATCSSSPTPAESDDISLFLHQILLRSSSVPSATSPMAQIGKQFQSCSSSRLMPHHLNHSISASSLDRIAAAESSSGFLFPPATGSYLPASGANVSSSSVGTGENEADEYDCESEEGFETLAEDMLVRSTQNRNSSKRTRAAEVHNMSEKRRRSRINEKMKALQKLIPNSNKTDKASMLDEAIEYLKQLQLQVQMLTMRNGLNLYPMCVPGVLQQNQLSDMRMGLFDGNGSTNMNLRDRMSMNQENPTMFNLPIQCPNPTQASETSFGPGPSSVQAHLRPFHLQSSTEENCRRNLLPHHQQQQLNADHSRNNILEFGNAVKTTAAYTAQTSGLKDNERQRLEGMLLTHLDCDSVVSSHLNSIPNDIDDIKSERKNF